MQEFWHFLGNYWWLVFPLMAVLSGIAGSFEKMARRRHKRRLEIIRAKSEAKAALAAARPQKQPVRAPRTPQKTASKADTSAQRTHLSNAMTDHDDVIARWLDYELDVAKIIAFPAMSDGRQPLTAAFLRAKKKADALRPDSADISLSEDQLAEYIDAVGDFAVAFDIAEKDARRLRDSAFSPEERKRLERATSLLTLALDSAASAPERQLAYKRVRQEIDGLIVVPVEAIDVLEKKVSLSITEAPHPIQHKKDSA